MEIETHDQTTRRQERAELEHRIATRRTLHPGRLISKTRRDRPRGENVQGTCSPWGGVFSAPRIIQLTDTPVLVVNVTDHSAN